MSKGVSPLNYLKDNDSIQYTKIKKYPDFEDILEICFEIESGKRSTAFMLNAHWFFKKNNE